MAEIITLLSNSLTITVLVAYVFALWAALVVWAWIDVSSRTDNIMYRLGAILIVATGALLGFAIYLLLRPNQTKDEVEMREIEEVILTTQAALHACPNCHSSVKEEFSFCPNCSLTLSTSCQNCSEKISIAWSSCPYCGTTRKEVPKEAPVISPKEETILASSKASNKKNVAAPAFFSSIFGYLRKKQHESRKSRKKSKTGKKETAIASTAKAKKGSRKSRKRKS